MHYLFLMYGAESGWTDAQRQACMVESLGVCRELAARGEFVTTSPLQPVGTAATVRLRGGELLVTAGPFAETAEQLGGYFVLDLPDLEAAVAVAHRLPPVRQGAGEIRPLRSPPEGASATIPPFIQPPAGVMAVMLMGYAADSHAIPEVALADYAQHLREQGVLLFAAPLAPPAEATRVRIRHGAWHREAGAAAEGGLLLAAVCVILVASFDEAIQHARSHPLARGGAVEVRPLFDLSGLL